MEKPNAYLGLHEITIVDVSTAFEEAEFDSIGEGELIEVSPEDLYLTFGLRLDNDLPFNLVWPAEQLGAIADCFGVSIAELLDRNPSDIIGSIGKGKFYRFRLGGHTTGAFFSPIKKDDVDS
jgi:hypothetical protein